MHVAFLNSLYPPHGSAGAETTLRLLVRSLQAAGHRCTVLTLSPGQEEAGEIDGAAVHYLPLANVYWPHGGPRPRPLRPVFQAMEAWNPVMGARLRRALVRLRPDVLHAHNLQGFSCAAWTGARQAGVPVVQTLHDYYAACPRSAMWRPGRGNCATPCGECRVFGAPRRALSRGVAAVTSVSHRVFDRLHATGAFPGAGAGQPVRIIRGNNGDDALPDVIPPGQPGAAVALRLGFLGRLDPSKGLENLLAAFGQLSPGAATLAVAGQGPAQYEAALRALAPPGVSFLGFTRPAEFFPRIDLLTIPSVWEDPFPRVFHEALAYGVPSLVPRGGGLPEVVRHGETGFVLDGEGPAALVQVLRRLVDPGWDRRAMFDACRHHAAAYAPSRVAAQYEAVLLAAAQGTPVPPDAGEAWHGPRRAAA